MMNNQKPLTRQQISEGNQSTLNVTRDAFVKGVKFAEKMHGIGVDDELRGYVKPLYTAPPKREPFGPEERERLSRAYSTKAEQVAFEEGIIFAEISYGIGSGK
jgi:hypothetical protein